MGNLWWLLITTSSLTLNMKDLWKIITRHSTKSHMMLLTSTSLMWMTRISLQKCLMGMLTRISLDLEQLLWILNFPRIDCLESQSIHQISISLTRSIQTTIITLTDSTTLTFSLINWTLPKPYMGQYRICFLMTPTQSCQVAMLESIGVIQLRHGLTFTHLRLKMHLN